MAFLGAIKTLIHLAKKLDHVAAAKRQADELRPLRELPPGFGTPEVWKVGNPVFDKAADKIGMLPDDLPMLVSEFYNWISGLRTAYFSAVANGPTIVQTRVAWLDFVAVSWQGLDTFTVRDLVPKLEKAASERWSLADRIKGLRRLR